jgi:serine protease inhibitor
MSRLFRLAVLLCATALPMSCASTQPQAEAPAATSLKSAGRVSISDTELGLAVFRRMMRDARDDENPMVSPWGLGRALDVLYNGASGQTKADMARVLQLGTLDVAAVDDANQLLARNLRSGPAAVSVEAADALWHAPGSDLNPEFAERIEKSFGVRSQSLDFTRLDAASRIEDWVRTNSLGGAPAYAAPVNPGTKAVLVDVVRIDALWNKHFDPALTRPHAFTTTSGRRTVVPMMKMTDTFPYAEGPGFQIVSIPYYGWRLSMEILLPDATSKGMRSVESALNPIPLANLLDRAPHVRGTVEIPRFAVRFTGDLNGPISQLGLRRIFEDADFSGMWAHENYPVDRVIQQCYVSVNEWGTKAGSTTSVTVQALVKTRPPFAFVADHPFVFLIRDQFMGTVLFAGLVNRP